MRRRSSALIRLAGLAPVLLSLWVLAFAPSPASSADWPQFRGPTGQGTSPETSLPVEWGPDKNIAWKIPLPGPGGSSPAVFGDRIYLTCYRGYNEPGNRGEMSDLERLLLAIDRKTGNVLWTTPTRARLPEQESIRDEHGYATSTPAVDRDGIVVFYGKGGVHAFTHDGKPQWDADVGTGLNGWGSAASPVIHGDLVLINASVESETLFALDRKSGKVRWKADGIRESWNTPVIVKSDTGREELIVAIFGKVLAFDPATGKPLWNCDTDIGWYMVPSVVAEKGVVYCIGGRSGGSLAIRAGGSGDVTRSHRLWVGKKGSNVSSPVFLDGRLYFAHEQLGIAHCADARTGEILYEERLPRGGQIYPSTVLGDGKVYFTSRTGKTFVVAAGPEFKLLATNELGDRSLFHASPAIADGHLYIRSDRMLYSIGRP